MRRFIISRLLRRSADARPTLFLADEPQEGAAFDRERVRAEHPHRGRRVDVALGIEHLPFEAAVAGWAQARKNARADEVGRSALARRVLGVLGSVHDHPADRIAARAEAHDDAAPWVLPLTADRGLRRR